MKKIYFVFCGKYRKLKSPKISYVLKNTFKEEESIKMLKILVLIKNI